MPSGPNGMDPYPPCACKETFARTKVGGPCVPEEFWNGYGEKEFCKGNQDAPPGRCGSIRKHRSYSEFVCTMSGPEREMVTDYPAPPPCVCKPEFARETRDSRRCIPKHKCGVRPPRNCPYTHEPSANGCRKICSEYFPFVREECPRTDQLVCKCRDGQALLEGRECVSVYQCGARRLHKGIGRLHKDIGWAINRWG